MLPFPLFNPAAITAEKDAVSRLYNFGSSIAFRLLLQSNDVTTLCTTGSQQGVDVPDTVNAVGRCCANVERAERELLAETSPWRPCVSWGRTSSPPASPVAFSEQTPSAFHSVPGVFYSGSCLRSSDVLGAALPPWLDFSIVDTFAYLRVPSEHSSSPRFGSHVFRGGGVPTLLPQARLPRETISFCWGASPPVDAVGRLAQSASTSCHINRCHEGTLVHARTL